MDSSTRACFFAFFQSFKIVCGFSASAVNYTVAESRVFVVPESELISRFGHVWKTCVRQFADITYKKNIFSIPIFCPQNWRFQHSLASAYATKANAANMKTTKYFIFNKLSFTFLDDFHVLVSNIMNYESNNFSIYTYTVRTQHQIANCCIRCKK